MAKVVKLVVYVPAGSEEDVRLALGRAGAGKAGKYDFCSFVSDGVGHYRPLKGAQPYKGRVGEIEDADECRIETVCYETELPKILKAMRKAHPYEEVAYDIVPLLNGRYAKHVPKREQ